MVSAGSECCEGEIVGFGGEEAGAGGGAALPAKIGLAGGVGGERGEGDGGAGEVGVGGGKASEADGLVDCVLLRDAEGVAVADVGERCEWEEPGAGW